MHKFRVLALGLVLAAVPFLVQPQTASASPTPYERLFGSNRLETANAVADKGWPNGAFTVILARDDDFPDALAGAPLAHKLDAPILLTNRFNLSPETAQEIAKLKPNKIIILGSPYAVSTQIENTLRTASYGVERLEGTDRFGTAAKIAEAVGGTTGQAVVAYGLNFPDALAVSPWAAKNGVPILLTETNNLPEVTSNALKTLGVYKTAVVGSNVVISDAVLRALPSATRYSGPNRFATAKDINARIGTDNGTQLNPNNIFLATGMDFPDALAGAALAAKNGNPIVLTEPTLSYDEILGYIHDQHAFINNLTVLGSEAVVSADVVTRIRDVVQCDKFNDYLNREYNNYRLIAGFPLYWEHSGVSVDSSGYLNIMAGFFDQQSSNWDYLKYNNQTDLDAYLKSIVTDAEKEFPNKVGKIMLGMVSYQTFATQQTYLPPNAVDQWQLSNGSWIVVYFRSITWDYSGSILNEYDPAIDRTSATSLPSSSAVKSFSSSIKSFSLSKVSGLK